VGLKADSLLLDSGGSIRSNLLRRIVKSLEYLVNLVILSVRFAISRPDILHVQFLPFLDHGYPFEIWFLNYIRCLGIPVVYTVHNLTHQDFGDRHKAIYVRAYALADILICHGHEARERLVQDFGVARDKIRVIPHGPLFDCSVSTSQREARVELGLPTDEAIVLCLGVISEYKGIPFLLDAWKYLVHSGTKGRLLVAGTGDDSLLSSIVHKVHEEGISASVSLWLQFIPVKQLPLLYLASDILVYPYKAGTTSGALLTGMNYRKPIVATKLPFFREYLKDQENALLVDYGDVEGLSFALQKLITNPVERTRLAGGMEKDVLDLASWSKIAETTRQSYEEVLRKRGTRHLVESFDE
jgi:glycosyltransferase involved in cell wall biosynthesis